VRGGYGIYYARTPGLLLSTAILNNGFATQQFLVTTNLPTYPNILTAPPRPGSPPDIYVTDRNFKTPRTQQFSLQTEIAAGRGSSDGGIFRRQRHALDANTRYQPARVPADNRVHLSDSLGVRRGAGHAYHVFPPSWDNRSDAAESGLWPHLAF